MYRQIALAPGRGFVARLAVAFFALAGLWFALTAIATPFDHDESQYIAGAYFSSHMLIFRDFLYLQPPVHSWLFAPLTWLFPQDMVAAMRLATAATALGVLLTLWNAQRIAGISRDSAAIATALAGATAAFQFTGSVVRNDMLATLLTSLAMLLLLAARRNRRPGHWFGAGFFFGLAIATKLNFAPLALAAGLFTLQAGGREGWRTALLLALGGLAGCLPLWVSFIIAPESALYGIFTFGATAPHAWYTVNGAGSELLFTEKLADLLKFLAKGPALVAMVLLAGHWWFNRNRVVSPGRCLSRWMICGGLLGAALPTPSQLQYVMALTAPLALGLGYLLDDARRWPFATREAVLGVLCLASVPGMLRATGDVVAMAQEGSPITQANSQALWMGALVRAGDEDSDDSIATLSPHLAVDSGVPIDPRFATGPFVYRSGWTVKASQARRIHAMTPEILTDLDRDPPDAILVGYEQGTRKLPLAPDSDLMKYAKSRRYKGIITPDGVGRLFIRFARSARTGRIMR